MDTREEKIGPVAILETKEGLRIAVYVVRTWDRLIPRFGHPVDRLIRIELKTDGGQYVMADHDNRLATIYGGREPIVCSVVSGSVRSTEVELSVSG